MSTSLSAPTAATGQVPVPVGDLQTRAERGDAAAAFQLGHVYATGEGTPADDTTAAFWYLIAAESGVPEAQFAVGLRYATGDGVARDLRQAHMWINLAAVHSVPGSWEARDRLADLMNPAELAAAVRMALDWEPRAAGPTSAAGRPPRLP